MATNIKFNNTLQKDFYPVLKNRIENYFVENNISKTANGAMVAKTVFILGGTVAIYLALTLLSYPLLVMFLLWGGLGFFTALIGLNICHDAIHGAYSKNEKVNKYLGYLFNVAGANAYNWNKMHNVVHHSFTNIDGHDGDIEFGAIVRVAENQKLRKMHRFQHIYIFALYCFSTLHWVFIKDYLKFFSKKIGNISHQNHPKKEYVKLFLFKAVYYTIYIVLPLIFIDFSWWVVLLGFLFMHLVEGFSLAIIFALAHVVEDAAFPEPNEKGKIEDSWFAHQLRTTANFAINSRVVNFICGGLNFQVEHHLFPRICHIHYRGLAPIVRDTAHEYGLPYIEYKTFAEAVRAHIRHLKKMGRDSSSSPSSPEKHVAVA